VAADALVEAAWAAARTKNTYLSTQFHRLTARRGKKRALIAVAHTILIIMYSMLRNGAEYQDLGVNYFDEREKELVARRVVRRLEKIGYKVNLEAA
jgi:transposase